MKVPGSLLLVLLLHVVHADDAQPDWDKPEVVSKIAGKALFSSEARLRGEKGKQLVYPRDGKTPLTGWIKRLHDNGRLESLKHYAGGKEDGPFIAWYADGAPLLTGLHKKGQRHGCWRWRYENGQLEGERHYRNGLHIGHWAGWHENGQKKWQHHYNEDGKQEGAGTGWYQDGQKSDEYHYKDGKKHGVFTRWRKDGSKESETHYKEDKRHGTSARWDHDGSKLYETHYKDDKKHGPMILYGKDGNKFKEWLYQDGEEVKQ
jgi:antitoxin component YwqK of YwqJK toxin-antitoxin module